MRRCSGWLLSIALLCSTPLAAGTFDDADALFAQRESGRAAVTRAKNAYLALVNSVSGADLAYAVQQIGLLAIYEGLYLVPESDNSAQVAIWRQCRDLTMRLKGQEAYRTIYSYWRMACSAQFMRFASLLERLRVLPEVKEDFNDLIGADLEIRPELNIDQRYQGGGINRVLGKLYANSLANLVRDDLPNNAKALEMVDRSFQAAPYPGDVNWGYDYYRNHRYKADVLIELGRSRDARTVIDNAIAEIEDLIAYDELPVGIEPETLRELDALRAM